MLSDLGQLQFLRIISPSFVHRTVRWSYHSEREYNQLIQSPVDSAQ